MRNARNIRHQLEMEVRKAGLGEMTSAHDMESICRAITAGTSWIINYVGKLILREKNLHLPYHPQGISITLALGVAMSPLSISICKASCQMKR